MYQVHHFDNFFRLFGKTGIAPEAVRFPLGDIIATTEALVTIDESGQEPEEFLKRHQSGDWGDLSESDLQENELSVNDEFRILSAYHTTAGEKLWIITEADRSSTTILLPCEY